MKNKTTMKKNKEMLTDKSPDASRWSFKKLRSRSSARKVLWRESAHGQNDPSWLRWTSTLIGKI